MASILDVPLDVIAVLYLFIDVLSLKSFLLTCKKFDQVLSRPDCKNRLEVIKNYLASSKGRNIKERALLCGENRDLITVLVRQDGLALRYVKVQTLEICIVAVSNYGRTLQFVDVQTPELCLAAVRQNGFALLYVKDQTPEICLAAVRQDGYALPYIC